MDMKTLFSDHLSRHTLGAPSSFGNLTLFPVIAAEAPANGAGYLLLEDALREDLALVTELSEAGSVPELCFVNNSDLPVLLLDGEELVGAKQNRVLNLTVLVPPRSKTVIPVSCVEAGRWHAESAQFRTSPQAQHASGRASRCAQVTESLFSSGERLSNQHAVWQDIEAQAQRLSSHSHTRAMNQIFRDYEEELSGFVTAFPPGEGQCGALFAVGSRLLGLDLFDHPRTFARVLPKLVRSYALDSLETPPEKPPQPESAAALLASLAQAPVRTEPALSLGVDWRLASRKYSGGGLAWNDRFVHVYAFVGQGDQSRTRIHRGGVRP